MACDVATREWVSSVGGEYEVICPCGHSEYYAPGCGCEHCAQIQHPIQNCP